MKNNLETENYANTHFAEQAYCYCLENKEHEEIIGLLNSQDELKKQAAILNLNEIKSYDEASVFVMNLTGQSSLIREMTAIKLNEFVKNDKYRHFFQQGNIIEKLPMAIIDVNPTVCRNIIEILVKMDNKKYLIQEIGKNFFEAYEEVKNYKNYKSYEANKKIFKLYWYLESVFVLLDDFINAENFYEILKIASEFKDYTIREKAAKIVAQIYDFSDDINKYKNMLQTDENIYVRRYLSKL